MSHVLIFALKVIYITLSTKHVNALMALYNQMMPVLNVNRISISKMDYAKIALKIVYFRKVLINVNAFKVMLKT